jgi:hypothetical protein
MLITIGPKRFFELLSMMFTKVKLAPSHWCLFGSVVAHATILWLFMRVRIYPPFSLLPVTVRLADEFTDGRETTPSENSTRRIDPTAIRGTGRKLEASRQRSTTPQSNDQTPEADTPESAQTQLQPDWGASPPILVESLPAEDYLRTQGRAHWAKEHLPVVVPVELRPVR